VEERNDVDWRGRPRARVGREGEAWG